MEHVRDGGTCGRVFGNGVGYGPALDGVDGIDGVKIAPGAEIRIPDSIYEQIAPMDLSRRILNFAIASLLAFQLKNLEWNDLGNLYRVLATVVEKNGELPAWARLWPVALESQPWAARAAA